MRPEDIIVDQSFACEIEDGTYYCEVDGYTEYDGFVRDVEFQVDGFDLHGTHHVEYLESTDDTFNLGLSNENYCYPEDGLMVCRFETSQSRPDNPERREEPRELI